MTLQKKTLVVIALTLGISILALYFASRIIVLGSFSEQENIEATQNMNRVGSALDDALVSLEGTTRDWGFWDDTFNYVADKNEAYFNSNLADNTPMVSNQLNLMLFADNDGNVVYAKSLDYRTGQPMTVPQGILSQVHRGSPLVQHETATSGTTGIISLPEGAMLLAAEPVMHSSATGPIDGTVIFGRFLDTDTIQHLSKSTVLRLSLVPLADLKASGALQQELTQDTPIQVQINSSTTLSGYYLIDNVFGTPPVVMMAEMSRSVYERGVQTLSYYLFTLVCVGLILALVIWFMLKRLVWTRLSHLRQDMGKIGVVGDTAARVAAVGNDELSGLAFSINEMLDALHRSREEQRETEDRYKAVVEQTREAIFLVDAHTGQFIEANAAFQALLGYSVEELSELQLNDIIVAEHETTGNLRPHPTTGSLKLSIERKYRRKDGSTVNVEVSDSHILYSGRDVLCVVARDITDRKRAEFALRELARRDGLTGLYNRREMQRLIQEQIERHARTGKPLAFILLDIDHFKTVNDTYGHQTGDAVLRWMAFLIPQLVRPTDSVARYGGEEMAIILPDTTLDIAYERAEHIRQLIANQLFEYVPGADYDQSVITDLLTRKKGDETGVFIPITVSLGVSALDVDIDSEESLVSEADKALYSAKHHGRNCTVTSKMTAPKLKLVSGS